MKQRALATAVFTIHQQIFSVQVKGGGCRAREGAKICEAEGFNLHGGGARIAKLLLF
jgi:hypothetical protein